MDTTLILGQDHARPTAVRDSMVIVVVSVYLSASLLFLVMHRSDYVCLSVQSTCMPTILHKLALWPPIATRIWSVIPLSDSASTLQVSYGLFVDCPTSPYMFADLTNKICTTRCDPTWGDTVTRTCVTSCPWNPSTYVTWTNDDTRQCVTQCP